MPELPEVEILARHLAPRLRGRRIQDVHTAAARVSRPTSTADLRASLVGATIAKVGRRAKYLVITTRPSGAPRRSVPLLIHLGMTGRVFLLPRHAPSPRHSAAWLDLGTELLHYTDARRLGRITLDTSALGRLGPEPLAPEFTTARLRSALSSSRQAIKIALLDQSRIVGLGNIYAAESLHRARISPTTRCDRMRPDAWRRLHAAIRLTLNRALRLGSRLRLDFTGVRSIDGLFYYGSSPDEAAVAVRERFRVYDRAGEACLRCGERIRKITQAGRTTCYCPVCQK
jgi:formamidopyrimidine-DNA glycosylase